MNKSSYSKRKGNIPYMNRVIQPGKDVAVTRELADTAHDGLLFENDLDGFSSPLLTIPEVAKLLKISPTGVRRLQEQRSIPFLKVGGSVRFLRQDLLSYLRKQRVETIE